MIKLIGVLMNETSSKIILVKVHQKNSRDEMFEHKALPFYIPEPRNDYRDSKTEVMSD